MRLAWTSRWLLSPIAMGAILVDLEIRMASVKITIINGEDKETVIRNGIWFGRKGHRADDFTEISLN